jgi:DNA-binding response OmpR family regulator
VQGLQSNDPNKEKLILVLDDDPTLLKFFKIHLNKFYTNVHIAESAKQAFELFSTSPIDLIITDIRMPRTNGFQFLKKIKKHDASVPVVLLSGEYFDADPAILESAADGFLAKPFEIDELKNAIDHGLHIREELIRLRSFTASNTELLRLLKGRLPRSVTTPRNKIIAHNIALELKKAS